MEILRVEHLSRIYGKGETEVRALDDVSFTMEKGEMTAVMGRSGFRKIHTAFILSEEWIVRMAGRFLWKGGKCITAPRRRWRFFAGERWG